MTAFIPGKLCSLRPLTRGDVEGPWKDWFNDPQVTAGMLRGVFPNHYEEQVAFYEHISSGAQSDVVLAVVTPDGRHVGTTGLHRIDWVNRSAEYGLVLGDEAVWGTGVGTEATRLLCRHGFDKLNLHRIWVGVLESNVGSVRMCQKAGFREEGRLREVSQRDGRWQDSIAMAMLADELTDSD